MGFFSCLFSGKKAVKIQHTNPTPSASRSTVAGTQTQIAIENGNEGSSTSRSGCSSSAMTSPTRSPAKSFTYRDLCIATGVFHESNAIGSGGFGKVYKGKLSSGEVVAVKQLDHNGNQGVEEFITEVLMLSLLHHPNLMSLVGFCSDGDERLLVYEYMPKGCLEDHLFDYYPQRPPLDWLTRMKIALGTAKGLEYLHCRADPPVIYRDLKSANILLDNDFDAKLSDFGLAKLGPVGDNTHVSTRVMGTYGYCAPEYAMSGKLTPKSDVYSFGVVLLELITGRRAIDHNRCRSEQNLVNWAHSYFKDKRRFNQLVDPALEGRFPKRGLHHAVAIAAMCLQEQPSHRPLIRDIRVALEYLAERPTNVGSSSSSSSPPEPSTPPRGTRYY